MPGIKNRRGVVLEVKKDTCKTCGNELKPVLFMDDGKKRNCLMCDCGVFNKVGKLVHSF